MTEDRRRMMDDVPRISVGGSQMTEKKTKLQRLLDRIYRIYMIYFLPFQKKGKKVSSLLGEASFIITFLFSHL